MAVTTSIRKALIKVGTAYTIIRDSGNVTGNYLYYKENSQVTKPFIREHFLEAMLPYDATVVAGEVILFTIPGTYYIVMNITPSMFKNQIIKYESVLYKSNVEVTVLRPSERRNSNSLQLETAWVPIVSGKRALLTSPLYGIDLDTDEELGLIGLELHELYVPTSYGIQVLDRIRLSNGDYYRVEAIKPRRFENVDVMDVGKDTRASTTTTTTSSSTTTTTTA